MTRMCGARERDRRSPSRTTSWSSTIRQVISDFPSALAFSGTAPRIVFGQSDREGELLRDSALGLELDAAAVAHAELPRELATVALTGFVCSARQVGSPAVELS